MVNSFLNLQLCSLDFSSPRRWENLRSLTHCAGAFGPTSGNGRGSTENSVRKDSKDTLHVGFNKPQTIQTSMSAHVQLVSTFPRSLTSTFG
jgi:hypothetical protein